jgi:hypothetical protein
MRELTEWWTEICGAQQQWLILGKGPSYARFTEYDVSDFRTIALNHVVREQAVDVASAIDLDVVRDCAEAIRKNARFLLMPRYPHVNGDATERPLESYFDELPVLRALGEEGRLVWYNLSSSQQPVRDSPVIPTGCFSAEVMVRLIGQLGGRFIRTLGVDGWRSYSEAFADLREKTCLNNGQPSFDLQFKGIEQAISAYGLDCRPLVGYWPIRMHVFVGTDETQLLGARVLHYSILKHTRLAVEFVTMEKFRHRIPKDPANYPRTGFSFTRFMIPERMAYKGRAVYMDADMQVFQDFLELWHTDLGPGGAIGHVGEGTDGRPRQFSVLVLDCDKLPWKIDEIVDGLDAGEYDYKGLMHEFCVAPPGSLRSVVPPEWNSLEHYEPGVTRLLHYTDMPKQPWVSRMNRYRHLWVDGLAEAIEAGFIQEREVSDAIRHGYARPSLWADVRIRLSTRKQVWGLAEKIIGRTADRMYVPHRAVQAGSHVQRLTAK